MTPALHTQDEIYQAFARLSVYDVSFWDTQYVLPSLAWLESFALSYSIFREQQLINFPWQKNINDCDKFSRDAEYHASKLHRRTFQSEAEYKKLDATLAFGVAKYAKATGVGHAINVVVVNVNNILEIRFWEPQSREVITLFPSELTFMSVLI